MSDLRPHGAEPYRDTATPTIPCAKCGDSVLVAEACWSEQGERICERCDAVQTIETGDNRATSGIVGGGMGAFFLGLTSICFNPVFVMSFLAIGTGVGTLVTLHRHPEYRQKMGWKFPAAVAGAVIGILLGLVHPAILALATLGAAALS